jgi:hypothetical protein
MMSLSGRAEDLTKEEHEFFVDRIRFGAEFRRQPASAA